MSKFARAYENYEVSRMEDGRVCLVCWVEEKHGSGDTATQYKVVKANIILNKPVIKDILKAYTQDSWIQRIFPWI